MQALFAASESVSCCIGYVLLTEAIGATTGKCSHGGKDDSSRTSIARCGINKESVEEEYSPHNHLHDDAYIAAVKATGNFLIANGTSCFSVIFFSVLWYLHGWKKPYSFIKWNYPN